MGRSGKLFVSTGARAWLLRHWETPRVFADVTLPAGAWCVEIGCGRGFGGLVIARRFNPARVVCLDVDADMVRSARRMMADPPSWAAGVDTTVIQVLRADATALPFPSDTFHAAFLFAVLHHVPDWRRAIAETFRVLRPGGVFSFEDTLLGKSILCANRWLRHALFDLEELGIGADGDEFRGPARPVGVRLQPGVHPGTQARPVPTMNLRRHGALDPRVQL